MILYNACRSTETFYTAVIRECLVTHLVRNFDQDSVDIKANWLCEPIHYDKNITKSTSNTISKKMFYTMNINHSPTMNDSVCHGKYRVISEWIPPDASLGWMIFWKFTSEKVIAKLHFVKWNSSHLLGPARRVKMTYRLSIWSFNIGHIRDS